MAVCDYVLFFLTLQSNEDNGGRTRKVGSIVSLSCDRRNAEKKSD